MPKKRTKSSKNQRTQESSGRNGSTAHLEQVRHLLFGDEIRRSDARLGSMEKRVSREIQKVRTDLTRRLDALAKKADRGQAALTERLDAELDERDSARQAIDEGLAEVKRVMESETRRLSEEFAQRSDELSQEVDEELSELRSTSVTKEELSRFFADIALRLIDKKQIRRTR